MSAPAPDALDAIARCFRAGEFETAAVATQELLQTAARASREAVSATAEQLLSRPELQPLFPSPERAAGAIPFYRWLSAALESALGPHHLAVAFAQTRLASALAVGGRDEDVGAVLAEIMLRARASAAQELAREAAARRAATSAPLLAPPQRTTLEHAIPPPPKPGESIATTRAVPHRTSAPPPRATRHEPAALASAQAPPTAAPESTDVCAHLAPVLAHALAHGGRVQAEVVTSDRAQRLWIYLDGVVLDAGTLIERFGLPPCVSVHSEIGTGPRPAYGIVCTEHRDAVLGLHPTRGLAAALVR